MLVVRMPTARGVGRQYAIEPLEALRAGDPLKMHRFAKMPHGHVAVDFGQRVGGRELERTQSQLAGLFVGGV